MNSELDWLTLTAGAAGNGAELVRVAVAIDAAAKAARERCGLSCAQARLMLVLGQLKEPASPTKLAFSLQRTAPSALATVRELSARGLVAAVPKDSGRRTALALTRAGHDCVRRLHAWRETGMIHLSPNEPTLQSRDAAA